MPSASASSAERISVALGLAVERLTPKYWSYSTCLRARPSLVCCPSSWRSSKGASTPTNSPIVGAAIARSAPTGAPPDGRFLMPVQVHDVCSRCRPTSALIHTHERAPVRRRTTTRDGPNAPSPKAEQAESRIKRLPAHGSPISSGLSVEEQVGKEWNRKRAGCLSSSDGGWRAGSGVPCPLPLRYFEYRTCGNVLSCAFVIFTTA